MKSDGTRKFGYGVDVMRAWAVYKDSDKSMYVSRDQIEEDVNKDHKMLRNIFRTLLGYISSDRLDVNTNQFDFNKLTIVDKFMMSLLFEFANKVFIELSFILIGH
jgi:isoleucyl-tRNA synthetase